LELHSPPSEQCGHKHPDCRNDYNNQFNRLQCDTPYKEGQGRARRPALPIKLPGLKLLDFFSFQSDTNRIGHYLCHHLRTDKTVQKNAELNRSLVEFRIRRQFDELGVLGCLK